MRKLAVFGIVILFFGMAMWILPEPPEATGQQEQQVQTELSEVIDGIAIPYEVLLDAQMEHPGYAVSDAQKVRRDGQERYRLRLENSDRQSGRLNIYLMYDNEWRLMGEEQSYTPPPRQEAPAEQAADAEGSSDELPAEPEDEEEQDEEEDPESEDEGEEAVEPTEPRRRPRSRD